MKKDLITVCNDKNLVSEKEFHKLFCRRCQNYTCERSSGMGLWQDRMSTQEDRLLISPQFASTNDPRFEHIRKNASGFQPMESAAEPIVISTQQPDFPDVDTNSSTTNSSTTTKQVTELQLEEESDVVHTNLPRVSGIMLGGKKAPEKSRNSGGDVRVNNHAVIKLT
jgi:hypothetical protein